MYARRGGLVGDQAIAEPELLAERDAFRLLREQRVGAGVDREAVDLLAQDDAAGPRRALEDRERHAALVQLVAGGQPGDAAADDDDIDDITAHRFTMRVIACAGRDLRAAR